MEPILVVPHLDKKIRIKVDVSNYVTERVSSMKCEDRKWRPVVHLSKLLNEIHNKEMLAVIRGLEV